MRPTTRALRCVVLFVSLVVAFAGAAPAWAQKPAPTISASMSAASLSPGEVGRISVSRSTDGGLSWAAVRGAVFRSPGQAVLRVDRHGRVTALKPGSARVEVRKGRERASVVVRVRGASLTSQELRAGASCDCSSGVLSGSGFEPSSEVRLATDGTSGLAVDGSVLTDAAGAFTGVVGEDGYAVEGPVWSVDRGGPGAPEEACLAGTPWIITATDVAGRTAVLRGSC